LEYQTNWEVLYPEQQSEELEHGQEEWTNPEYGEDFCTKAVIFSILHKIKFCYCCWLQSPKFCNMGKTVFVMMEQNIFLND
jgi:hypothetical protein